MSDTATTTTTSTDPAKPDASATQPSTNGTGTSTPDPDATLGEAGKRAISEVRRERDAAQAERDRVAAELEELRTASQTEAERAIAEAKKAGAAEATTVANRRIVQSEVKAAASGKISDPNDAIALLGDLDRFIKRGEVDSDAITAAIDDLIKAKPYLAPAGTASALPGGAATTSSGTSMTDEIRRQLRR